MIAIVEHIYLTIDRTVVERLCVVDPDLRHMRRLIEIVYVVGQQVLGSVTRCVQEAVFAIESERIQVEGSNLSNSPIMMQRSGERHQAPAVQEPDSENGNHNHR